jgi:hypothetical protein
VRDIPDVSLFAANGVWGHYYVFCYSEGGYSCSGAPDTWAGAGGTSFASPIMAGIQALVNQYTGSRQGNPNPTYYALANTEYGVSGSSTCNSTLGKSVASSCIFYDVTQGDMDVPCAGPDNCYTPSGTFGVMSTSSSVFQPAYAATTGWDFATGIGSVNAYNLVKAFSGGPTPTPTPSGSPSVTPTPTRTPTPTATPTSAPAALLVVTPSIGNFGDVKLKKVKIIKLKLKNQAKKRGPSITISGFGVTDYPVFNVINSESTCFIGTVLAPQKTCVLAMGFQPAATGFRTGTLTIDDDAYNAPQYVPLSGTGNEPKKK